MQVDRFILSLSLILILCSVNPNQSNCFTLFGSPFLSTLSASPLLRSLSLSLRLALTVHLFVFNLSFLFLFSSSLLNSFLFSYSFSLSIYYLFSRLTPLSLLGSSADRWTRTLTTPAYPLFLSSSLCLLFSSVVVITIVVILSIDSMRLNPAWRKLHTIQWLVWSDNKRSRNPTKKTEK